MGGLINSASLPQIYQRSDKDSGFPLWFRGYRQRAWERFAAKGFPSRKDEGWRYTSLREPEGWSWSEGTADGREAAGFATAIRSRLRPDSINLVLWNGRLLEEYSDIPPAGAPGQPRVFSLSQFLKAHPVPDDFLPEEPPEYGQPSGLEPLNQAFAGKGLVMELADGLRCQLPVYILNVTCVPEEDAEEKKALLTMPFFRIRVGRGACIRVTEQHLSFPHSGDRKNSAPAAEKALHNSVCTIVLKKGAELQYRLMIEAAVGHYHIAHSRVYQEQDSHFDSFSLCHGGLLARHDQKVWQLGPHAHSHLSGLFIGSGQSQVEQLSTIFHTREHGSSKQRFRGILADSSTGVFMGTVKVFEHARKVDARQLSKSLLCSDTAKAFSRPQLEIATDDVRCSHGSTVSQLRGEELFYCQSRGIAAGKARAMLSRAFAEELLLSCHDQTLSHMVRPVLDEFSRTVFCTGGLE